MLLTRRNEGLETLLKQELDRIKAAEGRGEEPGKKAKGRPKGKGKGKAKAND